MGAQFEPSLTNRFMSPREQEAVYSQSRPALLFYKRNIDNILLIQRGSAQLLQDLMYFLNDNQKNIELPYTVPL